MAVLYLHWYISPKEKSKPRSRNRSKPTALALFKRPPPPPSLLSTRQWGAAAEERGGNATTTAEETDVNPPPGKEGEEKNRGRLLSSFPPSPTPAESREKNQRYHPVITRRTSYTGAEINAQSLASPKKSTPYVKVPLVMALVRKIKNSPFACFPPAKH